MTENAPRNKGVLRKEMNNFAMEKLVKRWGNKRPITKQPKNLEPYRPGTRGIFLPSQSGGLPHEADLMASYMKAARECRAMWEESVTAAFVDLKELADNGARPNAIVDTEALYDD